MLWSERTIKLSEFQNISRPHNQNSAGCAFDRPGLQGGPSPAAYCSLEATRSSIYEKTCDFVNKWVEQLKVQIFLCLVYREPWWQNREHSSLTLLFTRTQIAVIFICEAYYRIQYEDLEMQTIGLYCLQFHQQKLTCSEQGALRCGLGICEPKEAISITFFIYGV
jgi:hypothetical protein